MGSEPLRLDFPEGRKFAFTIVDDTDVATVENVRPVYRLLESLGMRTTKTVWPVRCPEGSKNFWSSETLEDPQYLEFVQDLSRRGFEITWHGATMESSPRERIIRGLEHFREALGAYPRIQVNHSHNRENLYWGKDRFDIWAVRAFYGRMIRTSTNHYQGHIPGSQYWWGDICQQHFEYGRNLTFEDVNLRNINPSMPYRDPRRPLIPWWFSASDAEGMTEFNRLLRSENQDKLEREGGICIVATHLGKEYARNGRVHPQTTKLLRELAGRPGWFPTVGTLLEWLRSRRTAETLPPAEWRSMQWRWIRDLVSRKLRGEGRDRPPQPWSDQDILESEREAAAEQLSQRDL